MAASPLKAQIPVPPDNCAASVHVQDYLAIWAPNWQYVRVGSVDPALYAAGSADAGALFYVWSLERYQSNALPLDLYSVSNGHVGPIEPAFNPPYLSTDPVWSWGTYIQFESWTEGCQFYLRLLRPSTLMRVDPATLRLQGSDDRQKFRLAFRYRDIGKYGPPTLTPGDIALYTGPNYTGQAWILRASSPVVPSSFGQVAGLSNNVQSIRFGTSSNAPPSIGAIGLGARSPQGAAFAYDIPYLKADSNPAIAGLNLGMTALRILPLADFIGETHSCNRCDLRYFPFQSGASRSFAGVDFSGAILDGADLSGIDFTGAKFSGASLRGIKVSNTTILSQASFDSAVLSNSDLRGAIIQGAVLKGAVLQSVVLRDMDLTPLCTSGGLSATDLTDAQLQNANLGCPGSVGFPLTGANMQRTNFAAVSFGNSVFDKAQIGCASFVGADLRGASGLESATFANAGCPNGVARSDFTRAQLTFDPADLSLSRIPVATWASALTLNHAVLANLSCTAAFTGANLAGAQLQGLTLDGCQTLQKINLSNADLANGHFNGADLSGAALSGATLSGAQFQKATLDGAQLVGSVLSADSSRQASAANLQGAALNGADLSQSVLSGAYLQGVILNDADLTQATLTGADLQGVTMIGQPDRPVSLSGATLTGADFTGAFLYNVNASAQQGAVTAAGVKFPNATLVAVDFSGANLASNAITTFANSILYGSQFTSAKVSNVTFGDALLNQTPGASKLKLPAGACQTVVYAASQPPVSDTSVTCPNGNSGPCQSWYLPKPPPACPVPVQK